jgi:hypothetical protein
MPNWNELLEEVNETKRIGSSAHDRVRRKYLADLHELTGRNIIVYYSGWLQKPELGTILPGFSGFNVNDTDKNGFMAVIHGLDRSKGLDLLLHTPGGDTAATESLVDYLRAMFGSNIRAIVPQLALSAGTLIALACKTILMGEHSSLGPIDPLFFGLPAHGVIEEFKRAMEEVQENQIAAALWQPIIAKYNPTLIGECEKAIAWSEEMAREWLVEGMFAGFDHAEDKAEQVITELGDHALTKSHARHISMRRAKEIGLEIVALEDDQNLQEAVMSVHHTCILTFEGTPAFKIIENHEGIAYIQQASIRPAN